MSWVGVAIGGASLISGLFGGSAAQKAAQQQAAAEMAAVQLEGKEFNTITAQEAPFMQGGYQSLGQLQYLLGEGTPGSGNVPTSSTGGMYGSLLKPFTADMMQEYSPAYQFQAAQGRQGTLNGDASGAGALSGAAQKDLMSFNQNFANTAFSSAANLYNTQQNNIYSRLAGLTQLGQNAAANTGQAGTSLAQSMGQATAGAGAALAGGTVGAANAYTGALNTAGYLPFLMQNTGTGGGGAFGGPYSGGTDTGGGFDPYAVQTLDPSSIGPTAYTGP